VHELIDGGSTVLNEDETFSFSYFDYDPNFKKFEEKATKELERIAGQENQSTLQMNEMTSFTTQ